MSKYPMLLFTFLFLVWPLVQVVPTHAQDLSRVDKNSDKKISKSEFEDYISDRRRGNFSVAEMFSAIDIDGDGFLSDKEFANRRSAFQSRRRGQNQGRRQRQAPGSLKIGDVAPVFKLKSLDGKTETDLASFQGKKPVVLIFGSYT